MSPGQKKREHAGHVSGDLTMTDLIVVIAGGVLQSFLLSTIAAALTVGTDWIITVAKDDSSVVLFFH